MKKLGDLLRTSIIYMFPISAFILSLYARETSLAAKNALYLCLDVVIPSLFPFFVLSRLAMPYLHGFACPKILKRFTESFFRLPYYTLVVIVLGYLSGYPTGAKLARDMFDEGLLDSRQASKIIAAANSCSPLFIIGTIGAGLFRSIKTGFLLLLIHWISGLIAAFITGRSIESKVESKKTPTSVHIKKTGEPARLSFLFPSAIEEAAILCIKVTGYIVLFAVLSDLLARLGLFSFISGVISLFMAKGTQGNFSEFVSAFARGLIEIASGSQVISQIQGSAINLKLAAVSFICGFAGLSVHTQVIGIMKGTDIRYRCFLTGKLLHGLIAGLITLLAIKLIPMTIQVSTITAVPLFDFSSVRLITIGVIILSLGIAPYRSSSSVRKKS